VEGEVGIRRHFPPLLVFLVMSLGSAGFAQEADQGNPAQLNLRKSVYTREYQGKAVEGEERVVGRGDSLWRIMVQEKGLPEKRFRSYLVVIRGLNPQLKDLDVLRVGDSIFIPLRPDETLANAAASAKTNAPATNAPTGATVSYRVKAGEYLYQILRDRLGISDNRRVANYSALVKDLNPERKNWNLLQEGDIILLPTTPGQRPAATGAEIKSSAQANGLPEKSSSEKKSVAQEAAAPMPSIDMRDARRMPARNNLPTLTKVIEAIGGEVQSGGEELVLVHDSTVRINKSSYPVAYNPKLQQRVVLDPENNIPVTLQTRLSDPRVGMPVVSMTDQVSLQEAGSRLLAGLGYQPLPADRSVVIQDEGIAFEARGSWMVLAPEESRKAQEVYIISLTDSPDEIPEYLRSQLALKGLHLKDVLIASGAPKAPAPKILVVARRESDESTNQIKIWPRDKTEIVDALLLAHGISFGVAETLSVELRDGLRMETRSDRVFDLRGQRTAIFFQRTDPEIKKALQEKQGVKTVELEIASLSSREIIGKLLNILGNQAGYREHRIPAANGSNQERLTLNAWGFLLSKPSMFITDREIPQPLHRFFFEKGLALVYFQ
jgi:hypothetical protein